MKIIGAISPSRRARARAREERFSERRRQMLALRSEQRRAKRGFVYFLRVGHMMKIGFSTNPKRRMASLKTGLSGQTWSLVAYPGSLADEVELHHLFAGRRSHGEWFRLSAEMLRFVDRLTKHNGNFHVPLGGLMESHRELSN